VNPVFIIFLFQAIFKFLHSFYSFSFLLEISPAFLPSPEPLFASPANF
jgi:hypothetical protein